MAQFLSVPYFTFGMENNVNQFVAPTIVLASIQIAQPTPTGHIDHMSTVQRAKIILLKNRTATARMIKIIRIQFAMNVAHRIVCFSNHFHVFFHILIPITLITLSIAYFELKSKTCVKRPCPQGWDGDYYPYCTIGNFQKVSYKSRISSIKS